MCVYTYSKWIWIGNQVRIVTLLKKILHYIEYQSSVRCVAIYSFNELFAFKSLVCRHIVQVQNFWWNIKFKSRHNFVELGTFDWYEWVPTRQLKDVAPPLEYSVEWREAFDNYCGSLESMVLFQHGQHDRRHLGKFTRQTKPQHFRNARHAEIHTHDSGAGKLCTSWNSVLLASANSDRASD